MPLRGGKIRRGMGNGCDAAPPDSCAIGPGFWRVGRGLEPGRSGGRPPEDLPLSMSLLLSDPGAGDKGRLDPCHDLVSKIVSNSCLGCGPNGALEGIQLPMAELERHLRQ